MLSIFSLLRSFHSKQRQKLLRLFVIVFVVLSFLCADKPLIVFMTAVRLLMFAVGEVLNFVCFLRLFLQVYKTHFPNVLHLLNSGCCFLRLFHRNNKVNTHSPNVLRRSCLLPFFRFHSCKSCQTLPAVSRVSRALPVGIFAGPEY